MLIGWLGIGAGMKEDKWQIKVSVELDAAAKNHAAEKGLSLSSYVRNLVIEDIKRSKALAMRMGLMSRDDVIAHRQSEGCEP